MSDEFLINTYWAQWQQNPDIIRLADGSIVVVWDSLYSEDNGHFYYIAAQRFSASGEPIGGEFVLDTDMTGQSSRPSITALADGGFAMAWEHSPGEFISGQGDIWTRTFDADGTPRGASVMVHRPDDRDQFTANVMATENGGYVVSWASYDGSHSSQWNEVYARTFDADGQPTRAGWQLNTLTDYDQDSTHAITLANGNVLIAWESEDAGRLPGGGMPNAVRARFYTAAGRALSDEFTLVNENDGMATGRSMDIVALDDGRFVVSWQKTVLPGGADIFYQIRARIFGADGTPDGQPIVVHSRESNIPGSTALTQLDNGNFVVSWQGYGNNGNEWDEVFARVYDGNGRALAPAFKVNPPSGMSSQGNPVLQALDGGGFMVVYESEFLDGDEEGIAGRIFGQGTDRNDNDQMLWSGTWHALGGNDAVVGTKRADTIYGDGGNDRLQGGGGDDVLVGGAGADRLNGGAGADRFVYLSVNDSRLGAADAIIGFRSGEDRIDFSAIDARTGRPGDQPFTWIGDAAFSGTAGELRFAGGQLSGDVNGDGKADLLIRVGGDPVVQADLIL